MIGFLISEELQIVIIGAIVTALIAPTWLSWWNSHLAKKELRPNGGDSMHDKVYFISDKIQFNTERIELLEKKMDVRDGKLNNLALKLENHHGQLETIDSKLDDHIEYMREVHDRSNKRERSTD